MLLTKPDTCVGCPLYGDGKGFVPDKIVPRSKLVVLSQNPGEDEEKGRRLTGYVTAPPRRQVPVYETCEHQPLVGKTGWEWERSYLPQTGLDRSEVSLANVLKCRWQHNGKRTNDLPDGAIYKQAVEHCTRSHLRLPASTDVVVAHGAAALDVTHPGFKITEWRGFRLPTKWQAPIEGGGVRDVTVVATLHVADLFREPRMRNVSKGDWRRVRRLMEGSWPLPLPKRHIVHGDEDVAGAWVLLQEAARERARVTVDTEYLYDEQVVPGQHPLTMIGLGWRRPSGEIVGVQVDWTSSFLSLDGRNHLVAAYRELIHATTVVFQNGAADIPVLAFNWSIHWGEYAHVEDLMLKHAVLWCELPHDLEFLASVYGEYDKMKHLASADPFTYNWGDVVETLVCEEKIERELQRDPLSRPAYETLVRLIPIHTAATQRGIAIDKEAVLPALRLYLNKQKEAVHMAQAYAGWPINPGSSQQLGRFLYETLGLPLQKGKKTKAATIDDDAIAVLRKHVGPVFDAEQEEREGLTVDDALLRIEEGANPALEARVLYAKAGQAISHYLLPLLKGVE